MYRTDVGGVSKKIGFLLSLMTKVVGCLYSTNTKRSNLIDSSKTLRLQDQEWEVGLLQLPLGLEP